METPPYDYKTASEVSMQQYLNAHPDRGVIFSLTSAVNAGLKVRMYVSDSLDLPDIPVKDMDLGYDHILIDFPNAAVPADSVWMPDIIMEMLDGATAVEVAPRLVLQSEDLDLILLMFDQLVRGAATQKPE